VDGFPYDRRAAKLYLKGRYFFCRRCYDLAYSSQREAFSTAPIDRAHGIRRRLGASADTTQPFPPRSKGMHRKTYERLHDEYLDAMTEHLGESDALLDKSSMLLVEIFHRPGVDL
jgi:hypothetical protein